MNITEKILQTPILGKFANYIVFVFTFFIKVQEQYQNQLY